MKILIAGVNGFVGKHLAREASLAGHEVYGTSMQEDVDPDIKEIVSGYVKADLTHKDDVEALALDEVDAFINLAGLAAVGPSFDNAELYMRINVQAHTVLCEALVAIGSKARVLCISTGAVYDNDKPMPVTEDSDLLEPGSGSPYSQSKIAMEKAVLNYADRLDVVVARPFNHIGPGQLSNFLAPDTFINIKKALKDDKDYFTMGPLDKARDFSDVRDVARAYLALVQAEKLNYKIFNVCSGKPTLGQEIVDTVQGILGSNLEVRLDETKVRAHDPELIYGDNARLVEAAGWSASYTLKQTLKDIATTPSYQHQI